MFEAKVLRKIYKIAAKHAFAPSAIFFRIDQIL